MVTAFGLIRAGERGRENPPPKAQPAPGNAQANGPLRVTGPLESRPAMLGVAAPTE
jgi:hypothetical protein